MDAQLNQSRFASVLLVLAGIWIATSPMWISMTGAALTSIIIAGSVIALAGLVQLIWRAALPSWVAGVAAVWLLVTALVLSMSAGARWNQVIFALFTLALAYWDGLEITSVQHHRIHRAM